MTRPIRTIASLGSRVQEHGRLRFGVMTSGSGRARPKAIDTWRFTSPDRDAITALAELYGGDVVEWKNPKANPQHQWQVISESSTIRVFLPPDSLSIFYEHWTAAGNQRRCDGITATIPSSGPDGSLEVPCVCETESEMACKPRTRLRVILPEIRFGGIWRLDTSSWNAAEEMPAMETMLQQLATHGILEAGLSLVKRSEKGGSRQFVVPRLEFSYSTQELLEGASNVTRLNLTQRTPEPPALTVASVVPVAPSPDEQVIEAEIVEFPEPTKAPTQSSQTPAQRKVHAMIAEVKPLVEAKGIPDTTDEIRHRLVHLASDGKATSLLHLDDAQLSSVLSVLQDVADGVRHPTITDEGLRFPRYAPGEEPFT